MAIFLADRILTCRHFCSNSLDRLIESTESLKCSFVTSDSINEASRFLSGTSKIYLLYPSYKKFEYFS